jgi:hypothetical protein
MCGKVTKGNQGGTMTIPRKIFSCMILACAVLSTAAKTEAQDAKAPFTLTLSSIAYEFRAGSEVTIEIAQTNKSDHTISCAYQGYAGVNHKYQYDVRDEDGKLAEKVVRPNMELEPDDYQPCNLAPGGSSLNSIKLSRVYKFDRPGKYVIQVSRFASSNADDPDYSKVQSNTIIITITG